VNSASEANKIPPGGKARFTHARRSFSSPGAGSSSCARNLRVNRCRANRAARCGWTICLRLASGQVGGRGDGVGLLATGRLVASALGGRSSPLRAHCRGGKRDGGRGRAAGPVELPGCARQGSAAAAVRDHRGPVILGASGGNEENSLSGIGSRSITGQAATAPGHIGLTWRPRAAVGAPA
jgi:hypothetical protein